MKRDNVIIERSMQFSIRIVNLYKYLVKNKYEKILSSQILRSGTSIGANISESQYASSRKDFIAKMHIALKECRETEYWLELLYRTDYISTAEYESMLDDCISIIKLLTTIVKTSKIDLKGKG